jgi:hypothetical protein
VIVDVVVGGTRIRVGTSVAVDGTEVLVGIGVAVGGRGVGVAAGGTGAGIGGAPQPKSTVPNAIVPTIALSRFESFTVVPFLAILA